MSVAWRAGVPRRENAVDEDTRFISLERLNQSIAGAAIDVSFLLTSC
jgi:hypothetical protein